MVTILKNVAIVGVRAPQFYISQIDFQQELTNLKASGSIGKIILSSLVSSANFSITVISRKGSEAVFPRGVTVLKSDFSKASLEAAFRGQDAVVSVVGATAFNEQKALVDAAICAGVQRFIPSEFSANSQSDAVLQLLPLFGQKNDLIKYLKSKEASGLTWTGIATSGLFDWGLQNRFLEFDISTRTATIWDGGDKSFTLTNEKQLGQSVISVFENPRETSNQYLYVASVETTQNEIVTTLEKVTGGRWTINNTTTDEQVSAAIEKLTAGDFSGAFTLVRATCFGNTPGLRANYLREEKLANDMLGLEMETVEDTIRRVIQ
ncbi:uncharacterized protein N7443_007822 [Penicillium atrosanguineum]|uniref:NmrA-like domain-containing protein n=1 Tax=Penicillium atrosanguineum TaxID=1132637 RepID=A0A9W9U1F1_9EURO|nr:uncharacterized protein N7443_007822 [Penicillium atrosanguineum]KAJ5118892.1 hypothetical protein N7526_010529 [Penicillium atrosanguineum]KAJ5296929.1 hypothetical protein N7443_007822 [Penicillium atrosanguineum]KAJ5299690.1 hypothetical protein N7476_011247 [Penicillium atrosanguineum]